MIIIELFRRINEQVQLYRRRSTTRRQLAQLSDAALKDIGVSKAEALTEAAKPFWEM